MKVVVAIALKVTEGGRCDPGRQYEHQGLCCPKCRPGQYVKRNCTGGENTTICATCEVIHVLAARSSLRTIQYNYAFIQLLALSSSVFTIKKMSLKMTMTLRGVNNNCIFYTIFSKVLCFSLFAVPMRTAYKNLYVVKTNSPSKVIYTYYEPVLCLGFWKNIDLQCAFDRFSIITVIKDCNNPNLVVSALIIYIMIL